MVEYSFVQSVKVVTGAGSVAKTGEVLKDAGYKKAFLVYDIGMKQIGVIDKIEDSLKSCGIGYVEYDKVLPDPPADMVDAGADICKAESCDCVIGIGGGSSIDTAKGINILRFNDGKILDYATKPMKLCRGLITIPTTAGTGSELSNGAIVSDTVKDIKMPILCVNNMSEYTILDPQLTAGMPYRLTLFTGLDVFSHVAEAYTSILANPMTDLVCEKMMETVVTYLPMVLEQPDNLAAREKMQCAASIGGWMLYNASAHVGHSLAHVLGAKFHIVHGAACAYGLPAVLRRIAVPLPEKVRYIGTLLGASYTGEETPEEIGQKAAEAYVTFTAKLQLPGIEDYKVSEAVLEELAEDVAAETFAGLAPIPVTKEAAKEMLKEILF